MSEIIVPNKREEVMAYIELERSHWLPWYHRARRADGMSGEANAAAAVHMEAIDKLLDELNAMGRVAVEATVDADAIHGPQE